MIACAQPSLTVAARGGVDNYMSIQRKGLLRGDHEALLSFQELSCNLVAIQLHCSTL